jgi:O-antigen/teichoic acid export membrane protein
VNVTFREIVKHAAVFGVGAVLFRLASIVLLPLYTHHLQPADYAIMAILDLAVNLLAIVGSGGIASAALRSHFEGDDEGRRDRVWWTALVVALVAATIVVVPAFAFRDALARLAFGAGQPQGGYYFAIALTTLWLGSSANVIDSYFRARKASSFLVGVSLFRLVVNVALNVTFLVWLEMGVAGILWGNLLSAALAGLVVGFAFLRTRGAFRFEPALARVYWRFGWPLVIFGLFSVLMHEADRFILRVFVDLREVGIYTVAYQIGQGVNTLVIMPFVTIWSALVYEIARDPGAKQIYGRVYKHFVVGLALVMLGASLFVGPALRLLAPPE